MGARAGSVQTHESWKSRETVKMHILGDSVMGAGITAAVDVPCARSQLVTEHRPFPLLAQRAAVVQSQTTKGLLSCWTWS
jgi:hypothetical protein